MGDPNTLPGMDDFRTVLRTLLREELAIPKDARHQELLAAIEGLKEHLAGRQPSRPLLLSEPPPRTSSPVGSEARPPLQQSGPAELRSSSVSVSVANQDSQRSAQSTGLRTLVERKTEDLARSTGRKSAVSEWQSFVQQQCTVPPNFDRARVRSNFLGRLVDTPSFSAFSGLLIGSNAIFIGIYTAFTLSNEYSRIDGKGYEEPWWINVQIFNALFFLEIMLRVLAERFDFFLGKNSWWNMFDGFVVLFSMSDFMWILNGDTPGAVPQVSYLRCFRLFRVIQTFRIFRLPFFSYLRMMTNAMALSMPVAFWAVCTFAVILYIFAVAFALGVARLLQKLPEGWSEDPDEVAKLHLLRRYFGSVGDIFLHLYMAITGGVDWENVYLSMAVMNTTYRASFIVFSALMFFLVINIVVGMVIERAFKVVRQDRDFYIAEAANQSRRYEDRVRGLFYEMDLDNGGTVSWDEFSDTLNNPHIEAYLSFVELDTANLFEMFQLLDKDGSQTIEVDEFIDGIHELRGNSTKVQMKLLKQLVEDLWEVIRRVAEDVAGMQTGRARPMRTSISQAPDSGTNVLFRGMSRCTESQGENPLVPRRSRHERQLDGTLRPSIMDSVMSGPATSG